MSLEYHVASRLKWCGRGESGEREPGAGPSDQDSLVLDLGTGHGIDLEATEQGLGIKSSSFGPQSFRHRAARPPGAVHGHRGAGDCLNAGVVDARLGVIGVRGEKRGLGWPYLEA